MNSNTISEFKNRLENLKEIFEIDNKEMEIAHSLLSKSFSKILKIIKKTNDGMRTFPKIDIKFLEKK